MRHLSRAGHVESCPNPRGPSRKAKDCRRPIVDQYREGKVGSTPGRGVKQSLKPRARKRWEPPFWAVTACLLHNEPTSCAVAARLSHSVAEPERERV